MALNKYFPNYDYGREQALVEDLIIEAIKIHGVPVYYVPRTVVRDDPLFGEDTLSTFSDAIEIEAYVKNVEGFGGEGEFLSKFNLEIHDQVTFTIAKKRFEQSRTEKILTEVGYNYVQETANTGAPSRFVLTDSGDTDCIVLETATSNGYSITSERPMEGDLIFFPLTKTIFEIKFVEHEAIFYQTGRLQTYDLQCEQFVYTSERIDTGLDEIDEIPVRFTTNVLDFEFELEDESGVISIESGGSLMQEYRLENTQPTANNEYFEANKDPFGGNSTILDFSEYNPFSELDRY